ncbi:hypothetical protein ACI6PX_14170 [Proteus sp. NGCRVN-01]|uniref:hypothetical protein n=1 Tax=Proteus sp. NGCRVN-01 TaxID=3380534 RepID=UPI0038714F2F
MENTSIQIDENVIVLIDTKAARECGETALLYASTYTRQLNDHICGINNLSAKEIATKVDYLVGCLTLTLNIPTQGIELLRARYCSNGNFGNIQELSYIQNTTKFFPNLGRLNQIGQTIFYASVVLKKDDSALGTVLSEVKAKKLDHLNVLRSHQKTDIDLNLRMIGIWEYVRRDEKPYYLSQQTFEYYKKIEEYRNKRFNLNLTRAYELTERFLADILSRQGSERLYQVTSAISEVFLDDVSCDGILYSSVMAKGEPVVALKPQAVDTKISHQFITDVIVNECYGYEFYDYKTLGKTVSINSLSDELVWIKCEA